MLSHPIDPQVSGVVALPAGEGTGEIGSMGSNQNNNYAESCG